MAVRDVWTEPWSFGHDGWHNDRAACRTVLPAYQPLWCAASAWTPGTPGPVTARVTLLRPPLGASPEELSEWIADAQGRIAGRAAMLEPPAPAPTFIETWNPKLTHEELGLFRDASGRSDSDVDTVTRVTATVSSAAAPSVAARRESVDRALRRAGAALRLIDSTRDYGVLRADANPTLETATAVPTLVLRSEDYGRIARLISAGVTVRVEVDVQNSVFPEGRTEYNLLADMKGTTTPAEVVLVGAHLDSWHVGPGATDNAVGVAVILEAVRLLKAVKAPLARTVRVAFWSGEEQGMLGSKAYARRYHEHGAKTGERIVAYLNVDGGTGRLRGAMVYSDRRQVTAVLRELFAEFADLGVAGAVDVPGTAPAESDHVSFSEIGIPSVRFHHDPIHPQARTWHTDIDTYERLLEDDMIASATVLAAAIVDLARSPVLGSQ